MNTVYHRIDSSSGSVVSLRASGVAYHELAPGGRLRPVRHCILHLSGMRRS